MAKTNKGTTYVPSLEASSRRQRVAVVENHLNEERKANVGAIEPGAPVWLVLKGVKFAAIVVDVYQHCAAGPCVVVEFADGSTLRVVRGLVKSPGAKRGASGDLAGGWILSDPPPAGWTWRARP